MSRDKKQKSRYALSDNRHRDVFDQRDLKRVERKNNGGSRKLNVPVFVVLSIAAFLVWSFITALFSFIINIVMHIGQQNYSAEPFSSVFKNQFVWHGLFGFLITYGVPLFFTGILFLMMKFSRSSVEDVMDLSQFNTYENDGRLQQPEELISKYNIVPDAGAHSKNISPTAVLGHMMLTNKGLKKIKVPMHYKEDVLSEPDADGDKDIIHRKGEIMYDDNGKIRYRVLPLIDEKFGDSLFDSALVPKDPQKRLKYDSTQLLYNPKKDIDKDNYNYTNEFINDDWYFPDYEVQRPAGGYIVDTSPNNTMLLAMTRAGKGQDIIEPTLDVWTRMDNAGNIVVNDPKGELYRGFYYPASRRGYEVIAFNLINDSKTNIYNPLGYAVDAAIKDDNQKVEDFVNSIGNVFFPVSDKTDDPMWPNAANSTFKRSALGLIDYYKEEDQELRAYARRTKMSPGVLNHKLDVLWGHVTPYNVYQMMTQLASKNSSDVDFIHMPNEDDDSEEKDYLTLFFDATNKLPRNSLRISVANEDNSLRAMAKSDKTISSVYGISLTAIKFFANEKIRNLTSGRPSQNFDMVGMAFPRRIEVRFDVDYLKKHSLFEQRFKFQAYEDVKFEKSLGKKFEHTGNIDSHGWLLYAFEGIFPRSKAYIKLEIYDSSSDLLIDEYYFRFTKGYQTSLDSKTYVTDPVKHQKIIRGGSLRELKPKKAKNKEGKIVTTYNHVENTVFKQVNRSLILNEESKPRAEYVPVISQVDVQYSESPKMIFCVTPPHMMEYARLILIMLNQMFDMQVDKAYLTKANQKPLYKTRYMLDEIGNLQSEGNGIPFLQTKESIGLGQSQQYTLILQTLQQLKDVYGDSIDKILQANTSNILYLKSTDTDMLEQLEKMSGKRHESRSDQKTQEYNRFKVLPKLNSTYSVSTSLKEVPVISVNDMLRIPRNSMMVFGQGDPIWAINQLGLPMAWRLHQNQIHDLALPDGYALATVPSTSNTSEFDVLNNQPNFMRMVEKRVSQAKIADDVLLKYKEAYGINSEDTMSKLDPEKVSKQLMEGINSNLIHSANQESLDREQAELDQSELGVSEGDEEYMAIVAEKQSKAYNDSIDKASIEHEKSSYTNKEFHNSNLEQERLAQDHSELIFANNTISKAMLITNGHPRDDMKISISKAYDKSIKAFNNDSKFMVDAYGSLRFSGSKELLIQSILDPKLVESSEFKAIRDGDTEDLEAESKYAVDDRFVEYLFNLESWDDIASGQFQNQIARVIKAENKV